MNLDTRISAMSGEMVESLQKIIRYRSVMEPAVGDFPYGQGIQDCLEAYLALCASLGLKTKNVDNVSGWAEFGEGEEMVGVVGHLDVVPEGTGWHYPPFGGVVEDGKLYGRGTIDDKGPMVAALYALKAIMEEGIPLKRRIRLIFGVNEENGCAGIAHYVTSGEEIPVTGFTPDGAFPIINGEKGIVAGVYRRAVRPSAHGIRHLHGGDASNMVPALAVAELDWPAEEVDAACALAFPKVRISPADGGLRVEAEGICVHGSTPEEGENAVGRLFLALSHLPLDGDSADLTAFMCRAIGMETRGQSLGIAQRDDLSGDLTVNLGIMELSQGQAEVTLNIRYPVTHELEDFHDTLVASMAKGGFTEVSLSHDHSIYASPETPLIQTLSAVYEEKTGNHADLLCIGGGTYAKDMPNIVAFGPIYPEDFNCEHQADEYIEIRRLIQTTQILAEAMKRLAE
jgi:succinyl-diaminopimelate desuccinylase